MYLATEAIPMKNFDMVIPIAICHFCPHQSEENEMRNHIIQSHYDHVSKFWKICKFCAKYYPTDLEFKNHICVLQSGSCGVCGQNLGSKSFKVNGSVKTDTSISKMSLYQHMRFQHLDIIKVRKITFFLLK